MRMKRNESVAGSRTLFLDVRDADGGWVVPTGLVLANLLYDPGTGHKALAGGTLIPSDKPYTFTGFTFTTTNATETVNKVAHGLLTGDGPVQLTTTGTLPAGYALLTNYWVIKTGADTLQLASSLANALAGTAVNITTDGTGTHTLSPVAGTKRLLNGQFVYTFTQAETNVTASWISITVEESASFSKTEQTVDLYTPEWDEISEGAWTRADIQRLHSSILAARVGVFNTSTLVFRDLLNTLDRWVITKSTVGRLTAAVGGGGLG